MKKLLLRSAGTTLALCVAMPAAAQAQPQPETESTSPASPTEQAEAPAEGVASPQGDTTLAQKDALESTSDPTAAPAASLAAGNVEMSEPPSLEADANTPPTAAIAATAPAAEAALQPSNTAAPSPASESTPIKVTGSFFGRYEARHGYSRMGVSKGRTLEGDMTAYRARLGIATLPMDLSRGVSASVRFVPQASGSMGQLGSTVEDAALGLHEGYLRLEGQQNYFDLGRFEMDYGDALVIGNLGWHQTARSFDGGRLHLQGCKDSPWVDVFMTQLHEGISPTDVRNGANDLYFAGAYADLGPWVTEGLALDVYELNQIRLRSDNVPLNAADPAAATGSQQTAIQATVGARAKQTIGIVDYRIEAGYQFGQRAAVGSPIDVSAYQVDAEVGISPISPIRAAIEGFFASGDDPATAEGEGWDQLYPTAHKWLGLADIIGARSNIYGAALHLKGSVTERTTLLADVQTFFRQQHLDSATPYAGTEIDLLGKYTLGKGVTTSALYALFFPSDDAFGTTATAQYFELQLGYGF